MGALKTLIQNLEYFYCVFVEDFAPIEFDFMEKEISTFFDKKNASKHCIFPFAMDIT